MRKPGRAVVTAWRYEPSADQGGKRTRSRVSQKSYSAWIGVAGSLLLHAILFQSVLLGAQAAKVRRPVVQGAGAARIPSRVVPSETLILLNLSSPVKRDTQLMEDLASAGSLSPNLSVTLISPDALPHFDIRAELATDAKKAAAPIDSGDSVERAALFGRYTGQIDARIERAWRRPRTPVDATSAVVDPRRLTDQPFKCQVRILQDRQGAVREIQLLQCNGSAAWRQSLVTAILTASPLPAPPKPAVFSDALTLTFVAHAFTSGSDPDDYALPRATSMQAQTY